MRSTARNILLVVVVLAALAALYVGGEVVRTLRVLESVERERDQWQRPDAALLQLDLQPGDRVVDVGAGAGYFALKLAPAVLPNGSVLAVDLRRESLAFLWLRARLRGYRHVSPIVATIDDPRLPAEPVDAALIANTYHELTSPEPILSALSRVMHAGSRLVILDRQPRVADGAVHEPGHGVSPDEAIPQIREHGFRLIHRDDALVDRVGEDDVWWLLTFERR